MTFLPVAWANGDVVTEVKLDQMVANEVHVQAELESQVIFEGTAEVNGTSYVDDGPMSIRMNGSAIIDYAAEGSKFSGNVSLVSVTDGLVELDFYSDGIDSRVIRFIKTANMVYLTAWVQYFVNSDGDFNISRATLIAHKDTQAWTA